MFTKCPICNNIFHLNPINPRRGLRNKDRYPCSVSCWKTLAQQEIPVKDFFGREIQHSDIIMWSDDNNFLTLAYVDKIDHKDKALYVTIRDIEGNEKKTWLMDSTNTMVVSDQYDDLESAEQSSRPEQVKFIQTYDDKKLDEVIEELKKKKMVSQDLRR